MDAIRMKYLVDGESIAFIWSWCFSSGNKNRRVLSWVNSPKMDPDMKILVKVINYEVILGETIRGMAEEEERKEASQARVECLGCSIVERCLP